MLHILQITYAYTNVKDVDKCCFFLRENGHGGFISKVMKITSSELIEF